MNKYRGIFNLPILWLIYHMFMRGYVALQTIPVKGTGFVYLASLGVLNEFKNYRNILYICYFLFFCIESLMIQRGKYEEKNLPSIKSNVKDTQLIYPVSPLIVSLLLITFSFAIAALLLDIVIIFKPI